MKLFVRGIPDNTIKAEIQDHISQDGSFEIVSVHRPKDRDTYCYIEYRYPGDAFHTKSILSDELFKGEILDIEFAMETNKCERNRHHRSLRGSTRNQHPGY